MLHACTIIHAAAKLKEIDGEHHSRVRRVLIKNINYNRTLNWNRISGAIRVMTEKNFRDNGKRRVEMYNSYPRFLACLCRAPTMN